MAGSVCATHATKIAITVRLEIVIADQPAREADQDRREGRQPWPLRHLPAGRGCGVTADLRRHSVADRPTAGTARASMSGRREQNAASGDSRGVRRYAQTRAIQRSAALDRRLRAPVAGAGRDLLLPKPLTGAGNQQQM